MIIAKHLLLIKIKSTSNALTVLEHTSLINKFTIMSIANDFGVSEAEVKRKVHENLQYKSCVMK